MRYNCKNRIISFALVLTLLLGCIPGSVWAVRAKAESVTDAGENTGVSQVSSDRTTIYISSSGSELYSGTSASWPKKDVTKIPTYLAKG